MKHKTECRRLIADRLRRVRTELDLSQTDLADLIGKDRQFIQRLESGNHDSLVSTLYIIAIALNKPLTHITDIKVN